MSRLNDAVSGKTERALKAIHINAAKTVTETKPTKAPSLAKSESGGYFINLKRAAYLVMMIWNDTAQPNDRRELFNHLVADFLSRHDWFSQQAYMAENKKYRARVNGILNHAIDHLSISKPSSKAALARKINVSPATLSRGEAISWWALFEQVTLYLDHLFLEAAKGVHENGK